MKFIAFVFMTLSYSLQIASAGETVVCQSTSPYCSPDKCYYNGSVWQLNGGTFENGKLVGCPYEEVNANPAQRSTKIWKCGDTCESAPSLR